MHYELNPTLILMRQAKHEWQIETTTTRPRYAIEDERVVGLLRQFAELPASSLSEFEGLARREVGSEALVAELVSLEILTPVRNAQPVQLPAATNQFHLGTRDHPFLYMRALDAIRRDNARMQQYESESPPPPARLVFDYLDEVPLTSLRDGVPPTPGAGASAPHEMFGVGSPHHEVLSTLFDGVFGIRAIISEQWDQWQDGTTIYQYETLSKAVPSGGGMHPTECFGKARTCDGASFAFHYCAPHNTIGVVSSAASGPVDSRLGANELQLIIVSRLERAMWRYRDSRSARAVILDAGHVMGLLGQVSSALGLGLEVTTDIDDLDATRTFQLSDLYEPMFAVRIRL